MDVSLTEEFDVLRSIKTAVGTGCLRNLRTLVLLGAGKLVRGALRTWVTPLLQEGMLEEVEVHAGGSYAPWCNSELLLRAELQDARGKLNDPDKLRLMMA
jgi:hypothetical protein